MAADHDADEATLLAALRDGDERAFVELVTRHHGALVRLARAYARSDAVAEEVVQEAWMGVLQGLDGFQGRSSLRAWIARIVVNCARKRAGREGRCVPFSALGDESEGAPPSVDADRFAPEDHPLWPGHWQSAPVAWPEERLLSKEIAAAAEAAMDRLPSAQREVLRLRDVEGLDAEDVCAALEITPTNQRVLLHRARASVRRALESHFASSERRSA
ncbi:MAG: sigma-70 family RNA polymerase sigma factor [Polyangiaceae bacterium]